MHDVDHATCAECRFFVLAYPAEQEHRRLRGWGACTREGQETLPPAPALGRLRAAVLDGDRHALRRNTVGLYRSEPEDGCEFFEEPVLPLPATASEVGPPC